MTAGRFNPIVLASALLGFGLLVAGPSFASPQRPWYLALYDRVMRVVSNERQDAQLKNVENQLKQIYTSRISKQESTIILAGDVPSESDVKILQGVAAATSPGAAVTDKSRLNPNITDRDSWLAAMTFALRQLGRLDRGSAVLRNTSITIEGVTRAGDDFAVVNKTLRDEAPKGLILDVSLKPHDAHPFVWLAQLQPGVLILSGHVPNAQDAALCSHAQSLFQNLQVRNSMEFARGEPQDWLAATKLALEMLSLLYAGNAVVSDNVIKLDGIYSSPGMVEVMKSYSQRLPRGYRLETSILEPVARAPAARAEDVSFAARGLTDSMNP